jgi:protein TonB
MISWVRPLQLPESHTISVNLASTPSLTPPDTRRLGRQQPGQRQYQQKHKQASHRQSNEPPAQTAQHRLTTAHHSHGRSIPYARQ